MIKKWVRLVIKNLHLTHLDQNTILSFKYSILNIFGIGINGLYGMIMIAHIV